MPYLETAVEIAREAGALLANYFERRVAFELKGEFDLVTEADRASEKLVVFDGEPRVILGDMVRILDIAKSAGADQIALAVSHPEQATAADAGVPVPSGIPEPDAVVPDSGGPAPEPVAPSAQH